jgi:hypothetical protein
MEERERRYLFLYVVPDTTRDLAFRNSLSLFDMINDFDIPLNFGIQWDEGVICASFEGRYEKNDYNNEHIAPLIKKGCKA